MDYRLFHPLLDTYGASLLLAVFVGPLVLQHRRPLRRWVKGLRRRLVSNMGVAVPTGPIPIA